MKLVQSNHEGIVLQQAVRIVDLFLQQNDNIVRFKLLVHTL